MIEIKSRVFYLYIGVIGLSTWLVSGSSLQQVGNGLTLDALEVYMSTFGLLFLPRHVNKWTLHVIVDH